MVKQFFKYWLITLILLPLSVKGQLVGTFTSHLPYSNTTLIVESGNTIFCAAQRGLFFYDKDDNSTNILTSDNGLSDIEVTAMAFSENTNFTIVGYNSGNIDVIGNNEIINLTDIVRTNSIVGSKRINNITTDGNFAYLATDFGIVVLNLDRLEIDETYRNIGPSGEELSIENVIIDDINNIIYAHTEVGLSRASLVGTNLLNFQNWEYLRNKEDDFLNDFTFYGFNNGSFYGIVERVEQGIFLFNEETLAFDNLNINTIPWSGMNSISIVNDRLTIAYGIVMDIVDLNTNERSFFDTNSIPFIRTNNAIVDKTGSIWVADNFRGLISNFGGDNYTTFSPNGPSNSDVFGLHSFGNEVIALAGGFNISFAPNFSANGFYRFKDFEWRNFTRETEDNYVDYRDVVDIAFDAVNNRYFFAAFAENSVSGVVLWDGDSEFATLDSANEAITGIPPCPNNFRVTAVEIDNEGDLWVGNNFAGSNASVHRLRNNVWESFSLSSGNAGNIDKILFDNEDQLWILVRGGNFIVWDPETNEERILSTSLGNGSLPSTPNCYAVDRNGQVWVGTGEGVAVFEEPEGAITEDFYEATLPIFERRPLLQDEEVLSIAVDGANRKWFGTTNGAFLFDETGTEIIEVINSSNSILPSNSVNTIAINEETGEVFFGTDDGIVGFKGDATEPEETFSDAKIFPNPINPEFEGSVSITGLRESSIVKITDVAGRLIYESISNGGAATWNTRTLDGERAKTGVYLIYATDSEFEEAFVGKLIVVN